MGRGPLYCRGAGLPRPPREADDSGDLPRRRCIHRRGETIRRYDIAHHEAGLNVAGTMAYVFATPVRSEAFASGPVPRAAILTGGSKHAGIIQPCLGIVRWVPPSGHPAEADQRTQFIAHVLDFRTWVRAKLFSCAFSLSLPSSRLCPCRLPITRESNACSNTGTNPKTTWSNWLIRCRRNRTFPGPTTRK